MNKRYIIIKNKKIEVPKHVHTAYQTYNMYERRHNINKRKNEILFNFSEDINDENGYYSALYTEISLIVEKEYPLCISAEQVAIKNIEREMLYNAINELNNSDKQLIIGLFFYNLSETKLSYFFNCSQQMISKKKQRIIKELRKKLKNFSF